MLFKSLITLTAAIAVVAAVPHAVKRFDPLPSRANVWVQTIFGDTEAYMAATGEAWHWADENGDPDAPPINVFDVHIYPGFPAGSENVLISLSNGNDTCRFTPDNASVLNCRPSATGKTAVIRAKVMKDPIGETRWMLLGGYSTWSVTSAPESGELYWKVSNKPGGLDMGLYLQTPA